MFLTTNVDPLIVLQEPLSSLSLALLAEACGGVCCKDVIFFFPFLFPFLM